MNGRTLGAIIGASVGAWVGMEVTNKQVLPTVLFTGTFALLGDHRGRRHEEESHAASWLPFRGSEPWLKITEASISCLGPQV